MVLPKSLWHMSLELLFAAVIQRLLLLVKNVIVTLHHWRMTKKSYSKFLAQIPQIHSIQGRMTLIMNHKETSRSLVAELWLPYHLLTGTIPYQ